MTCCGTRSRILPAQLANHTGANNPRCANNPTTSVTAPEPGVLMRNGTAPIGSHIKLDSNQAGRPNRFPQVKTFNGQDCRQLYHLGNEGQGCRDAYLKVIGPQRESVGRHEAAAAQAEHRSRRDSLAHHCTKAVVYLLLGKRRLWAKEPG